MARSPIQCLLTTYWPRKKGKAQWPKIADSWTSLPERALKSQLGQGNVLPDKWSRRWANNLSLVTNFLLQLSHSYFNTPWWVSRWFLKVACSLYRLLQILHSRGNILCFSRQWLWKELKVLKEASQSMAQLHLYVVFLYFLFVFKIKFVLLATSLGREVLSQTSSVELETLRSSNLAVFVSVVVKDRSAPWGSLPYFLSAKK